MTAEKIAELKRLWAAATPGELQARGFRLSHTANRRIDLNVEHLDEIGQIGTGPYQAIPFARREDAEWHAALHNAFPDLIAALEAAEAERDERTTMAARAQEAMRYLLNGLPATDAIWAAYGNADSARAWLAARDARLKAEGAAEWLECHRNDDWLAVDQRERFDREAAELRREAGE